MAGYVKKIAVIKQLKGGFSADGGAISGLVKIETYAGYLKVEVSLINFAPLSEGRYVFGICDGENTVVFDEVLFECESQLNCQNGFAFAVCFCKGEVSPIASAYCSQAASYLPALLQEMRRREQVKPNKDNGAAYDDEAISEVNYYDNQVDKDGQPLCEGKKEEELRSPGSQNEEAVCPVKIQGGRADSVKEQSTILGVESATYGQPIPDGQADGGELIGGLAEGDFYSRMQSDIEKIFAAYPKASELEEVLESSRFVKIEYGNGQHYAFGVLYIGGNAAYICYGVPSSNAEQPPRSLKGFSSYIPCKNGGYWMTYQDAKTGVSVDVEVT